MRPAPLVVCSAFLLSLALAGCKSGDETNGVPVGKSADPIASAAPSATAKPLPTDDPLPPSNTTSTAVASATPPPSTSASSAATTPPVKPKSTPKPKATAASTATIAASSEPLPLASAAASATAPAAPPAGPGDPAANALAAKADAVYLPKGSLTAKFDQEFFVKANNQKKQSSGTMKFQRPGKMSWAYDAPNGNRVVSDGTTITIYEADNQQYTQQPFTNSEYPGALGFLTGDGITKHFTFTFLETAKLEGTKVIVGAPIVANPAYEKVIFYVDEESSQIRRVVIIDVQGNRNRFDFKSIAEGAIDASEFVWSPPAGATKIAKLDRSLRVVRGQNLGVQRERELDC